MIQRIYTNHTGQYMAKAKKLDTENDTVKKEKDKAVKVEKNIKGNSAATQAASEDPTKREMEIIKNLMNVGKAKGYITYTELNNLLPSAEFTPDRIDGVIRALGEVKIRVVEDNEVDGGKKKSIHLQEEDVLDDDNDDLKW